MGELLLRGYKTLDRLKHSHISIELRMELEKKLISILRDERFLAGEEHIATRYLVSGKKMLINYSEKSLKDLLDNIDKLLGD